jgi:hypothetical protein
MEYIPAWETSDLSVKNTSCDAELTGSTVFNLLAPEFYI